MEGAPIAKQLAARVRSLDATRPLTEAFPGATYTPSTDAVMSLLDVSGYNYNLKQNQSADHDRVPTRIMMTTESVPTAAFDNWKLAHEHSYILGEFVWTAMDYLGESGIGSWSYATPEQAEQAAQIASFMNQTMSTMGADGKNPFEAFAQPSEKPDPGTMSLMFPGFPWHAADSGDLDLTGYRKPESYYRDILWNGGDGFMQLCGCQNRKAKRSLRLAGAFIQPCRAGLGPVTKEKRCRLRSMPARRRCACISMTNSSEKCPRLRNSSAKLYSRVPILRAR